MNFKLRLKNKATLTALIAAAVAFVYQVLGIVGAVPAISQSDVTQLIGIVINLLVGIGVVVDPTTQGIRDGEKTAPAIYEADAVASMVTDQPTSEADLAAEKENGGAA
ncbi:MAG: phage holin [Pseudoramibacter sp.]